MRIAITGHKGQLGRALLETLQAEQILGIDLPEHDITDAHAISETLCTFRPEVVIHTAALTDVDRCAHEPELALQINGLGTHNIALACLRCNAALLTVSTNEVFDGQKGAPYYEHETRNPINAYGRSKLAAEVYTQMHLSRAYIVRTAWLYAPGGANFPSKIVAAARKHGRLRVVCDEVSSPTYAPDLADAIAALIRTEHYGIYHLTNEGVCSRYEFARRILALSGLPDTPLEPITSDQWPRASTPPLHCVIRNHAAAQLGIRLRPWDEALRAYFG
ncbi:MAG: dTDP-4-dehydrorhamnose reductase [Anaerolineae bacterium]|nr:dTDP-4-dehydrorhamnose reductase [Anaerolineae bacterium]